VWRGSFVIRVLHVSVCVCCACVCCACVRVCAFFFCMLHGRGAQIVVTVDGQTSAPSNNSFSYVAQPEVTHVFPARGTDAGGTRITVDAENVGADERPPPRQVRGHVVMRGVVHCVCGARAPLLSVAVVLPRGCYRCLWMGLNATTSRKLRGWIR